MAAFDALPAETIQQAEESLRRCAGDAFFQAFYRRLLSVDAATREKFVKTDLSRQNKVLQLLTVREFDPKRDAGVEDAWKRSVALGIDFIVDHYVPSAAGGA